MERIADTIRHIIGAVCICVVMLVVHSQVMAQDKLFFSIPAQSLESALSAFGEVTGYSVLVATYLSAGQISKGVNGTYAPRDALVLLLQDTGLTARYSGQYAFTLLQDDVASAPAEKKTSVLTGSRYAAVLQQSITRALCMGAIEDYGRYRLAFQLWIDSAGHVQQVALLASTGFAARDAQVRQVLIHLVMDAAPPAQFPQPVTIVLTPGRDPQTDCVPYLLHTG